MKTPKNQRESKVACGNVQFGWLSSLLAAALLFVFAGAASAELPNSATINKLARKAYCSEAKIESSELKNGRVSYKQVVERASNRALSEHPNVYRDSDAWKAKIVALLDQDGDQPSQFCNIQSLND
jgi:hypothetical protein